MYDELEPERSKPHGNYHRRLQKGKGHFPLGYIKHHLERYKIDTSNMVLEGLRLTVFTQRRPRAHGMKQVTNIVLYRWPEAKIIRAKEYFIIDLSPAAYIPARGSWTADKEKVFDEKQERWELVREHERARSDPPSPPSSKAEALHLHVVLHREGRDPGAVQGTQGDGPRNPGVPRGGEQRPL